MEQSSAAVIADSLSKSVLYDVLRTPEPVAKQEEKKEEEGGVQVVDLPPLRFEAEQEQSGRASEQELQQRHENLKSDKKPHIMQAITLGLLIIFFFIFVRYDSASVPENSSDMLTAMMGVLFMCYFGFGYLMTFLKKHAFYAVGQTYQISCFCILWAILCFGFFRKAYTLNWVDAIPLNFNLITNAAFCCAAVLITVGALIGKVSSDRLMFIAFFEVFFYCLNFYIIIFRLNTVDVGGTYTIHMFGSIFGLIINQVLNVKNKNSQNHPDNASRYNSDVFAMIGTVFLFLYWGLFNCALAEPALRPRAFMNTLLSIMASTFATFAASRYLRPDGKFNMVDIQNATLAGGVAMGSSADILSQPGGALLIGALAGILSTWGFARLQPIVQKKFNMHDTCGVLNLHCMPAILGGFATCIILAGSGHQEIGHDYDKLYIRGNLTPSYTAAGMAVAIILAIASAIFTGLLAKRFTKDSEEFFTDSAEWSVEGFELEHEDLEHAKAH